MRKRDSKLNVPISLNAKDSNMSADSNALFNIQTFLSDMREESQRSHEALVLKVDDGFKLVVKTAADHEMADLHAFALLDKRVTEMETAHKGYVWTSRTVFGALLMFGLDFVARLWKHA